MYYKIARVKMYYKVSAVKMYYKIISGDVATGKENMKNLISRYIVNLDPKIAGSIAALCPQGTIGRSLSQFIVVQYAALERERNELICQDCIVSLPVEIVDTLKWLYPNLPFSDQIINAVRTLVDLSEFNAQEVKDMESFLKDEVRHYHSIADLQNYYAFGGDPDEENDI